MDITTIFGLLLAIGLILGSIISGTAPLTAFLDVPSVLVVLGGTTGAACICFPLRNILSAPSVVKKVFLNRTEQASELIEQLVSLAETARRDGMLALETRLSEITNSFIQLGIQMAVDGTRPEAMEDILRTEMNAVAERHRHGKSIMGQMGRFAPAYGMIGTLMGLIMMLSDMSDPSKIGSGMATALITTLYGAIVANVVFIPFSEKLGFIHKQEMMNLEIIVRGIMAIQAGENPRVVEQKLNTFLPPKRRASEEAA
ncbi:MAG: motility protein A [Planctomycetota bacterium]